jgi:hypothetical protein
MRYPCLEFCFYEEVQDKDEEESILLPPQVSLTTSRFSPNYIARPFPDSSLPVHMPAGV